MEISELIKSSGMNPLQIMEFIQNLRPQIPKAVGYVISLMKEKEKEFEVDPDKEILTYSIIRVGETVILLGYTLIEKGEDTVIGREVYRVDLIEAINKLSEKLPF